MHTLLPLALFALVSSITPGPNNIMLASSGHRFGFVRSIPHLLGVTLGFAVMLVACAFGVGRLVLALPALQLGLKLAGSGYLLYLAWQLRSLSLTLGGKAGQKPMTFLGAAAFQVVNPKAWVMAVTGVAAFMPVMAPLALATLVFCAVFAAVNLPCVSLWAATGAALRRYLDQPRWQHLFCGAMMVLTLYCALAIWL